MPFTPGILLNLFPVGLSLIAWLVALIFAIKMVRRGSGRAERFLLAGVCLMLADSLISSVFAVLQPFALFWLAEIEHSARPEGFIVLLSGVNALMGIVALAGIICLVYAFWLKFKVSSLSNSSAKEGETGNLQDSPQDKI